MALLSNFRSRRSRLPQKKTPVTKSENVMDVRKSRELSPVELKEHFLPFIKTALLEADIGSEKAILNILGSHFKFYPAQDTLKKIEGHIDGLNKSNTVFSTNPCIQSVLTRQDFIKKNGKISFNNLCLFISQHQYKQFISSNIDRISDIVCNRLVHEVTSRSNLKEPPFITLCNRFRRLIVTEVVNEKKLSLCSVSSLQDELACKYPCDHMGVFRGISIKKTSDVKMLPKSVMRNSPQDMLNLGIIDGVAPNIGKQGTSFIHQHTFIFDNELGYTGNNTSSSTSISLNVALEFSKDNGVIQLLKTPEFIPTSRYKPSQYFLGIDTLNPLENSLKTKHLKIPGCFVSITVTIKNGKKNREHQIIQYREDGCVKLNQKTSTWDPFDLSTLPEDQQGCIKSAGGLDKMVTYIKLNDKRQLEFALTEFYTNEGTLYVEATDFAMILSEGPRNLLTGIPINNKEYQNILKETLVIKERIGEGELALLDQYAHLQIADIKVKQNNASGNELIIEEIQLSKEYHEDAEAILKDTQDLSNIQFSHYIQDKYGLFLDEIGVFLFRAALDKHFNPDTSSDYYIRKGMDGNPTQLLEKVNKTMHKKVSYINSSKTYKLLFQSSSLRQNHSPYDVSDVLIGKDDPFHHRYIQERIQDFYPRLDVTNEIFCPKDLPKVTSPFCKHLFDDSRLSRCHFDSIDLTHISFSSATLNKVTFSSTCKVNIQDLLRAASSIDRTTLRSLAKIKSITSDEKNLIKSKLYDLNKSSSDKFNIAANKIQTYWNSNRKTT